MRKSTLLISAALTAFMLVVLAGTASAVQNWTTSSDSGSVAASVQPDVQPTDAPTDVPVAAVSAPAAITPQQAAALAAKILNRTDLYSVETALFNGANTYKVTFSSGDLVYLGLDGTILSVVSAPVVAAAPAPIIARSPARNSGGGSGGGESEHENEHDD